MTSRLPVASRRRGALIMQFPNLPDKPDNTDLKIGIEKVHECLEAKTDELKAQLNTITLEMRSNTAKTVAVHKLLDDISTTFNTWFRPVIITSLSGFVLLLASNWYTSSKAASKAEEAAATIKNYTMQEVPAQNNLQNQINVQMVSNQAEILQKLKDHDTVLNSLKKK